jgi:3-dehydroquinate synthetase
MEKQYQLELLCAFKTSLRLGLCLSDHLHIVEDHFNKVGLLTSLENLNEKKISPEKIIDLMRSDKKVTNGSINLVLPSEIGSVEIRNDVDENIILDVLQETLNH